MGLSVSGLRHGRQATTRRCSTADQLRQLVDCCRCRSSCTTSPMAGDIDYVHLLDELGSSKFSSLRPAQIAALERYADAYSASPDLSIELPTGAGKSLVALLIS